MINNEPEWIEVNVQGETTGEMYFGKFLVKKYLDQEERSVVARESDRRSLGIITDEGQRAINNMIAQLQSHVVQADNVSWWQKDKEGRVVGLKDDSPITEMMTKLRERQNAWKPKKEEPKADAAAPAQPSA